MRRQPRHVLPGAHGCIRKDPLVQMDSVSKPFDLSAFKVRVTCLHPAPEPCLQPNSHPGFFPHAPLEFTCHSSLLPVAQGPASINSRLLSLGTFRLLQTGTSTQIKVIKVSKSHSRRPVLHGLALFSSFYISHSNRSPIANPLSGQTGKNKVNQAERPSPA
jgi:hypothetical protein